MTTHTELVVSFYRQAFNEGQPEEAASWAKRTVEQGDLIVTHSNLHLPPGDLGMAVADFWRIRDGRIVEHWDVVQQVPDKSANDNTMF